VAVLQVRTCCPEGPSAWPLESMALHHDALGGGWSLCSLGARNPVHNPWTGLPLSALSTTVLLKTVSMILESVVALLVVVVVGLLLLTEAPTAQWGKATFIHLWLRESIPAPRKPFQGREVRSAIGRLQTRGTPARGGHAPRH